MGLPQEWVLAFVAPKGSLGAIGKRKGLSRFSLDLKFFVT